MIDWEDAFVGMCSLLKEPADAWPSVSERALAKSLVDPDRHVRARVLADVLAQIVVAVDYVELTEIE